ncbi:hypothetical protein M433DRAFT_135945 [Acidomyces richmondensis BFW]|nr:hypothetical protein M433DRAFT_135945 [Acidomyces richmondensis BFW]
MTSFASVVCYDEAQQQTYINDCKSTNTLGATYDWNGTVFTCTSIVPLLFWDALQTSQLENCVCGYKEVNGSLLQNGIYGNCNGVCGTCSDGTCDFPNFTCQGSTPEIESGSNGSGGSTSGGFVSSTLPAPTTPVVSASLNPTSSAHSQTTVAPTVTFVEPTSSAKTSASTSSIETPFAVSWKTYTLFLACLLFGIVRLDFN